MLTFLWRSTFVVLCLFGPSALVVGARWWHTAEPGYTDDGWRRTADGWEHKEHWLSKSSGGFSHQARTSAAARTGRYDSHPAALVLGQVGAILLGFYAFPSTGQFRAINQLDSWQFYLERSFRASVFGA